MVAAARPHRPKFTKSLRDVTASELYYQLTYMSATASAGTTRNQIFELASRVPRPTAAYFEKVRLLAEKMGYDYARACSLIGGAVRSAMMRSLLLRISDSLLSGQSEAEFLAEEAEVQGQVYEKDYERDLSVLLKWTDAYGAMMVSAVVIIIVTLLSSMIYNLNIGVMVSMIALAVCMTLGGTWVLSVAAPSEVRERYSTDGPRSQIWALRLSRITLPVVVLTSVGLALSKVELGWILIAVSVELLPLGIASVLGGREIDAKDREIGAFLRLLGSTAVSTGTTLTEAMTRIDLDSFPSLQPHLEQLRFRQGISDPRRCWRKFASETGSALVNDIVAVFSDAVELGGDADSIGLFSSQFANRTVALRSKREVIASSFVWLTFVIHGAMAALMVIVTEVMHGFIEVVWSALEAADEAVVQEGAMILSLPSRGDARIAFLSQAVLGMVILLAGANALAILVTDGGHRLKLSFYLSILLFVSGCCLILLPRLVGKMIMGV